MDALMYWLWLTSIPGIGSAKVAKLLEVFNTPENVWKANKIDLMYVNILNKQDISFLTEKSLERAQQIYKDIKNLGINVLTIDQAKYPKLLKTIYDPPQILYLKGNLPPNDVIMLSVIGSRRASFYGKKIAEELALELAQRGVFIVSGMARGIDTCAHKGALKAGGKTIAVLGCGVDIVYPQENAELMKYIEKYGAVLSEYPPGTMPKSGNFPARNRIISGLSLGTIVVEAGEKSGSLITADFALEQGREVFAIPGNINSHSSKGTNRLIQQGAKLVTSIEDILEELSINILNLSNNNHTNMSYSAEAYLTEEEKKVINYLSDTPIHIDEISQKTGYTIQKINAILTMLEMKELILQLPGKYFVRK